MGLENRLESKPDTNLKKLETARNSEIDYLGGLGNKESQPQNDYPTHVYNLSWLKKADPSKYKSWLISRGHDDRHIKKQYSQYLKHFLNIAEGINDYKKSDFF